MERMERNINVTPDFVMAGEATFTVSRTNPDRHYTFHIYQPKDATRPGIRFAKVLTGSNNVDDYTYLGMVIIPEDSQKCDPKFVLTKMSARNLPDAVKILKWALRVIWQSARGTYNLPLAYKIQHDGRCGRCGRPLTTPASLDTGLGPDCAAMLGVPHGIERLTMPQLPVASSEDEPDEHPVPRPF